MTIEVYTYRVLKDVTYHDDNDGRIWSEQPLVHSDSAWGLRAWELGEKYGEGTYFVMRVTDGSSYPYAEEVFVKATSTYEYVTEPESVPDARPEMATEVGR